MSWLARSVANSLNFDEPNHQPPNPATEAESSPHGVKEDISELTNTISRHFWGVASFLAPPTDQIPDVRPDHDEEEDEEDLLKGIRSDFAEIGGRFKSGISMFSSNIAVSEITKMASNLLQIGSEGTDLDDRELIGVTEEVVLFARDLAMHPETWLDFPIPR